MHRIREKRLKEGKATEFLLQKRAVPNSKIDRWAQRTRCKEQSSALGVFVLPSTPPTIEYNTPIIPPTHIASPSELISFKNEIANKVYSDGLIDFGSAMAQSSIGMPLSIGYDVGKWFAQNDVELASTVVGELDHVAQRIRPADPASASFLPSHSLDFFTASDDGSSVIPDEEFNSMILSGVPVGDSLKDPPKPSKCKWCVEMDRLCLYPFFCG